MKHPTDHGASPSADAPPIKTVVCPGCGGDSFYAPSNPYRPFCSERCNNADFGAWASEAFRVSQQVRPEDIAQDDTPLQ